MSSLKVVKVCAALMLGGQGILVAKRKPHLRQGGLWEFPGGKQEAGESPRQSLARELREELGVEVTVGEFFTSTMYAYPDSTIELSAYWATCVTGNGGESPAFDNFRLTDHSEVRWVNARELRSLYQDTPIGELAPADIPIAEKLLASGCL